MKSETSKKGVRHFLGYPIIREIGAIFKDTIGGWAQANGNLLAAALSYYTIFSLTPLLVVAVSVAGLVFSEAAVTERLIDEVRTVIGPEAALAVRSVLANNHLLRGAGLSAGIGVVGMLVGASVMFVQLKRAINLMWGLAPLPKKGIFGLIRTHFLSFLMVFVVILMLLGLMFSSTLLVSLNQRFNGLSQMWGGWWPDTDFGLTFVGFIFLFGVIFKTLPDARTSWRDVLLGAAATSLLFTVWRFPAGILSRTRQPL